MKTITLCFCGLLLFSAAQAAGRDFKPTIKPYLKMQLWNVYSEGLQVNGIQADSRLATYFRRGRTGVKGKLTPAISYNLMLSFDYLGKDGNLASKGKANVSTLSLWYAYVTWKAIPESQWLMITGGTFLPHMSRESAASSWATSSLDKGESSCYLRQFMTGRTNGICPGINVGGLGKIGNQHLLYNVAIVSRQDKSSITTQNWSPVWMGHVVLNVGDAEWPSYKYTLAGDVPVKRKLLSVGIGASTEGKTDIFRSSSTYGADALLCLGGWNLDGEYYILKRKNTLDYHASCVMIRSSWHFFLPKNCVLEPAFMYNRFNGSVNYSDAYFYNGTDETYDAGVNFFPANRKLKLALHYIHRTGDGTKNHLITSSGTYGDYATLGIQLTL